MTMGGESSESLEKILGELLAARFGEILKKLEDAEIILEDVTIHAKELRLPLSKSVLERLRSRVAEGAGGQG